MGGYGSGRRKTHHTTYACVPIDTSYLLKHKMLTGEKLSKGAAFTCGLVEMTVKGEKKTERKQSLHVLVERYAPGGPPGEFAKWQAIGHVTVAYGVRIGGEDKGKQHAELPLVVTHPYYGGVRYWILAPCCGRRVRVVYLPTFGDVELVFPQCRTCLGLHYASQLQSYIERHKTYERYLLANYGWAWAEMDYHCLKTRYQEITPEIEYARQASILDMRMRMLRHLMAFTRLMMRTHMYQLRSIKSEEDRRVYLECITKEHGQSYTMDLVRMVGISAQVERDARTSSSEVFDHAYNQLTETIAQSLQGDGKGMDPETRLAFEEAALKQKLNMRYMLSYKEGLEEERKHLEALKAAA